LGQASAKISERPIEPKRDIEARVVFEIVAGEAAGQGDLRIAEIRSPETAAAACIVFLVGTVTLIGNLQAK